MRKSDPRPSVRKVANATTLLVMTESTGQRIRRGTRLAWAAENAGKHLCQCNCGLPVAVKPTDYPDVPNFLWGHNRRGQRSAPKPQNPCECRCGEMASPGRRFLPGHARRPKTLVPTPCECGCGELAGRRARYVRGHRARRPLADRFWEKVAKSPECWLWTGHTNEKGYGYASVNRRHVGAHRVSWELHHGPIPDGLEIDHLCFTRACVRPDHLEPVTHLENLRRAQARKRAG